MELIPELEELEVTESLIDHGHPETGEANGAEAELSEEVDLEEQADGDETGDDLAGQGPADFEPAEEGEHGDVEEQEESDRKLKIFISYNHNANDSVVAARIYEELSKDYDVFLDSVSLLPAEDYEVVTQDWLRTADFVIALISALSIQTLFMKAELQDAYERYKQEGRPKVIPVQVAYTGPYGLRLSAYIGHFQAVAWDNQDYLSLFEKLRAGLSDRLPPIAKPLIVGTDIIPITDNLRKRLTETFVAPRELTGGGVSFEEKRLLWVTGDPAVRNYVALSLAARTTNESVYEITKLRKWSEINNTGVSDSTIVLRDALPAPYLNESGAVAEWHSLRAIIERNNNIIATASYEEFERLQQELLRYQFTDYEQLRLGRNSYSDDAKRDIFNLFLDSLFTAGEIDEDKYGWASDLAREPNETAAPLLGGPGRERALEKRKSETRKRFRDNISRWSPADIERFVLSLSQVRNESEIAKLLQRTAAIEDEIRSWFLALDDSTRCFVLTVAIFPDLNNEELWQRYKIIVEYLRRFDQGLQLLPFGICRKQAQPNISVDGPIYLVDERVADTIRQELARSYREYLIELTPKLKEWSVPPGRNPKTTEERRQRKPKVEETREARLGIARMVGIVGRLGLSDLTDILDYWATDSNIQIRKSVALAFEQTAKSPTAVNQALSLLEKWCLDINSTGQLRWRALAAAIALGNVTAAAGDPYVTSRALQCLRTFARARRPDARFYASIALRQIARHTALSSIEGILSRLARDERTEVRINVAAALNESRLYDAEAAATLLDGWALSDNANRRWVALCGILTSRTKQNGAHRNKNEWLLHLLEEEETATSLASVLGETITDAHYGQLARDTFGYLAREAKDRSWTNFAAGLGGLPLSRVEKELLPLLRFPDAPPFDERAIDVRREILKNRLADPVRFLNTLKGWLTHGRWQLEVFRALTLLLDEAPDSCRLQFIAKMAEHFHRDPLGVNDMLATLEAMAPAHFDSLARAVRHEGFRRLFQDPLRFVELADEQLVYDHTSGNTREALESLAHDDPPGSREEMLRALLEGYASTPDATKQLLLALRSTGIPGLVQTAYEFNYRLVEQAISTPATLAPLALEMIRRDGEVLSLLNYLAAPEPQGKRSALVRALVESKLLEISATDELLAVPALKEWSNLGSLSGEVSRSFYIRKIFSPRLVSRLFRKRTVEDS